MPDVARTIIVAAGITEVAPFTIGAIPKVVGISPDVISDSILRQVELPSQAIIVGATDPQAAAAETLRTQGGIISEKAGSADSVILGRAIGTVASGAVAVGRGTVASSSGCIAIGQLATATAAGSLAIGLSADATGNNAVAVGQNAQATAQSATSLGDGAAATGVNSTAVGATAAASTSAIAIGNGTIANATGACVIGTGATANAFRVVILAGGTVTARADKQIWIVAGGTTPNTVGGTGGTIVLGGSFGAAITVTHADNILVGMDLSTFAANTAQFGGPGTPITTCVIGRGNTSTAAVAAGITIRGTNGITTNNIAMGDMNLDAPRGTGNAAVGNISLRVGQVQAAGNTLHTQVIGAQVGESVTAGDTYLSVFDVTNAALARVSKGAANSGGAGFALLRVLN